MTVEPQQPFIEINSEPTQAYAYRALNTVYMHTSFFFGKLTAQSGQGCGASQLTHCVN